MRHACVVNPVRLFVYSLVSMLECGVFKIISKCFWKFSKCLQPPLHSITDVKQHRRPHNISKNPKSFSQTPHIRRLIRSIKVAQSTSSTAIIMYRFPTSIAAAVLATLLFNSCNTLTTAYNLRAPDTTGPIRLSSVVHRKTVSSMCSRPTWSCPVEPPSKVW
jgi:hypothetical protein